ncbi:MAG: ankyrin repeat domain-containing protein [Spirochaetales bacterium]|nr:ankyrin repeat domain-containing protein [Spirochaetales bacterium]
MNSSTIIHAIMNNRRQEALDLIKAGADVNQPDISGEFTPLIGGCVNGDPELVQLLLTHGADPDKAGGKGFTPLHYAASKGSPECISALLSAGAAPDIYNELGETPLMRGADKGDVQSVVLLIAAGADVNAQSKNDGLTPLMLAADKGHDGVVLVLLQSGADKSLTGYALRTAHDYARLKNHKSVMELLKDEEQIVETNKKFVRSENFDDDLHKQLINAIWGKDLQKVVAAFEKGAWANPPEGKDIPIFIAARMGSVQIVRFLIEQGADVNAKDSTDLTPLSQACGGSYPEVAKLLMDNGAVADSNVFMAASIHQHPEIMKLLHKEKLKQGSPRLRKKGPGPDLIRAASKGDSDGVKKALEAGADVNSRDDDGASGLYWACRKGHVDIVKLLVEKKADTNAATTTQWTPIMEAAMTDNPEIVTCLIKHGADVNAATKSGATALIFASAEGYPEVVTLLLEHGADPSVIIHSDQNKGMTAYAFARKNGHTKIMTLLKDAGAEAGKIECPSCKHLNDAGKYCSNCGIRLDQ